MRIPSTRKIPTIILKPIETTSNFTQKEIALAVADPILILGLRDENLHTLETAAPSVRITVRGQMAKLSGPASDVEAVARIVEEMVAMGNATGRVTRQDMWTLLALYYPQGENVSRSGGRIEERAGGRKGHRNGSGAAAAGMGTAAGTETGKGTAAGSGTRKGTATGTGTSPETDIDEGIAETETDSDFDRRRSAAAAGIRAGFMKEGDSQGTIILHTHSGESVRAKTAGQQTIVDACAMNDIVFAIGPAGTGKTYTSVALAVKALKERRVKKIILARPAVEAGENLGFLPGDLKEKIDPYLRPLYDALEEMIETEKLEHLMAKNTIEIAPLAYMRGRTLNNAFVILDEAQNATNTQMKMFLTRIGFHSQAIITGDITQTDLPKKQQSGLISIQEILQNVNGISFVYLDQSDVVRHKLVRDIIDAYEKFEHEQEAGKG